MGKNETFPDNERGRRLKAIDDFFDRDDGPRIRGGASEGRGNDRWTYYNPREGGHKIRTDELGGALGGVGRMFGRLANSGEQMYRIQYQDEDGSWHDVPEGWEPGMDPTGRDIASELVPPPAGPAGGVDEGFEALLGAAEGGGRRYNFPQLEALEPEELAALAQELGVEPALSAVADALMAEGRFIQG